jgi:hypothetical protein
MSASPASIEREGKPTENGFFSILSIIPAIPKLLSDVFLSPKPDPEVLKMLGWILLGVLVLIAVGFALYYGIRESRKEPPMSAENVALTQGKRMEALKKEELDGSKSLYKDLIKQLAPNEQYLVNLCPLTANLGGYIGGLEKDGPGVFYSDFYIQNALRAGIRSFVLPVSVYVDDNKTPPNWPYSGDPAVVARDQSGKIISLNATSVKQICSDIIRFNSLNPTQSDEPILIFILEDKGHLPDSVKEENKYAKILSSLGNELNVIPESMRLTNLGSYGSGVGSENESTILTQIPLTQLKSKIIIFTDFQTKIGLKPVYSNNNPTLHNFVNFTIKPIIAQNAGLNVGNGARSLNLVDISGSSVDWKDQTRTVYHMASAAYNLTIPEANTVDGAVKAGVQVTPIPFFTETVESVKPIWEQWKGYAWRVKEDRYVKPDEVVPAKPSAKMNARVSVDKQPGQMVVG